MANATGQCSHESSIGNITAACVMPGMASIDRSFVYVLRCANGGEMRGLLPRSPSCLSTIVIIIINLAGAPIHHVREYLGAPLL